IEDGAPSSWRPPWLETTIACAPLLAASSASSVSRMPLRISLPGQIERIQSTSFQFSEVSNCELIQVDNDVMSSLTFRWPARLPKVRRLPRSTPDTQAGLVAKSTSFHLTP